MTDGVPRKAHDTILHISDVHATTGELLYGQVDGLYRLDAVAEYAKEAGLTPEAIVVTGDLVQSGHTEAYGPLSAAFDRIGRLLNAPVIAAIGNHDHPESAELALFAGERSRRSILLERMRIVVLDTSSGTIDDAQLDWLTALLEQPHGLGTVIVMHHAPLPSPLPTLAKQGLGNPERFASIIANTDVRLILAGHYHHPMSGVFAGIPVWVGPSLAYQQIMNAGPDRVSGHDEAMFSIVQIGADFMVTAPVSLARTTPLFALPAGLSTSVRSLR